MTSIERHLLKLIIITWLRWEWCWREVWHHWCKHAALWLVTLTLNSLPNFRSSSMWDLCWTDGAGGREKSFENFKQQHKGCTTRKKSSFPAFSSTKLKYLYSSCFPLLCSGSRRSVPLPLHRGSHSLWKRHNNPVSCRISNSKLMHTVKSLVL